MIGFLFDNDGILMDSTEFHWEAWQRLMQEDSAFLMTYSQFIHGFGKRNDLILQETLPTVSYETRIKWAQRKEELFRECAKGKITLLPGIENFLKELKSHSIPRIIASSTPPENLEMFLTTTVLGDYFNDFVSAENVAHGKPFPDVFIEAAKHLQLPSHNCIVIEDAPAGIKAAKKANCFAIALGTTHKKEELLNYDLFYPSGNELSLEAVLFEYKKYNTIFH